MLALQSNCIPGIVDIEFPSRTASGLRLIQHLQDESKKTALAILNTFDDDVVHLIQGTDIDRLLNATTLTHDFHQLFGNFECYFEPEGNEPHTYLIDSTREDILRSRIFPVPRTLFLTENRDDRSPFSTITCCSQRHCTHTSYERCWRPYRWNPQGPWPKRDNGGWIY